MTPLHWVGVVLGAALFLMGACTGSYAREGWQGRPLVCDPKELGELTEEHRKCMFWMNNVQKPDMIGSCCGEADAFIADAFEETKDGEFIAIITRDYPAISLDDGEGGSFEAPEMKTGTKIVIPKAKVNRAFTEDGLPIVNGRNPTGHGIVFMRTDRTVLCYFAPTLAGHPGPQFANRSVP